MPAAVAVLRFDHESKGHAIKGIQNHIALQNYVLYKK